MTFKEIIKTFFSKFDPVNECRYFQAVDKKAQSLDVQVYDEHIDPILPQVRKLPALLCC